MNLIKNFRIGIDEAGRGPRAGPVVACAMAFEKNFYPEKNFLEKLDDSKKISEKNRKKIFEEIIFLAENKKIFFEVGVVDVFFIDEFGIKKANQTSMQRALDGLLKKIIHFDEFQKVSGVFVDGNDNYEFSGLEKKPVFVIGGDGKIPEISAASIVAKVFRDYLMGVYAKIYPSFSFEKNKGYGTKKNLEALEKNGVTNIHRKSYLPVKKIFEKKKKILLHICCGVDVVYPILTLKEKYELVAYWYDPNIHPKKEHDKRYRHFKKICDREGIEIIKGKYDAKNFLQKIEYLKHTPERGEKCTVCYDYRLGSSAKIAKEIGADAWTTTLNSSPLKCFEKLTVIGKKYEKQIGIPYLDLNFRKGQDETSKYCKKHKVYRQNYCGCVYSDTFPEEFDKDKLEKEILGK